MLPFGMTIPATVPQRLEIPEGLMNYPVYEMLDTKELILPNTTVYVTSVNFIFMA
jgi:hypothetical protein